MRHALPPQPSDVFLHPGELHFGGKRRLRTLLGSCISVTVWHPERRIGGMCHFMLPGGKPGATHLDGRYAEDALQWLADQIRAMNTDPAEYETKAFGGSTMHETRCPSHINVANRNVESARRLIAAHNFHLKREHLAGHGHRNIIFDLDSGDVWVKHVTPQRQPAPPSP